MIKTLKVATRASPLALQQVAEVERLLKLAGSNISLQAVLVQTSGDRLASASIADLGGKGVFVREVSQAVLDSRADFAVHSAKDLPSELPADLCLAAVPRRADPRDALVGLGLSEIPQGGVVATGSPRRRVQLAALRSDLRFAELRGNIHTRLAKAAEFDAVVVAMAALERLDLRPSGLHPLLVEVMLPQAGQGALAIECRAEDGRVLEIMSAVEHLPSRRCVDAERSFLAGIGGDCNIPAAAHAEVSAQGEITLTAMLAGAPAGGSSCDSLKGDDPVELGQLLAHRLSEKLNRAG